MVQSINRIILAATDGSKEDDMEAESNRARSELVEWTARPWWRRLAG
ncbi:hypothetical protein MAE02_70930 [Microvirga aerophila]|uniref:Uncharacterized protein n=1 Tax=Microvirga aerophila TaxID=670291 RepID=A0A512C5Q5_9HYPH|nr:hypothetical protein MAE02_70930 [Microvirga aerophila]